MSQYCFSSNSTPDGQVGTGGRNWIRNQILDVFTLNVFLWKMHLNEKSLKGIGQSVPKVEQHRENPLSCTERQSGCFSGFHSPCGTIKSTTTVCPLATDFIFP